MPDQRRLRVTSMCSPLSHHLIADSRMPVAIEIDILLREEPAMSVETDSLDGIQILGELGSGFPKEAYRSKTART